MRGELNCDTHFAVPSYPRSQPSVTSSRAPARSLYIQRSAIFDMELASRPTQEASGW